MLNDIICLSVRIIRAGVLWKKLGKKLEKLIREISTIKSSKLDRIIVELENDTGLDNVSDYLFWPELIDGLGKNADAETKIKKILEDRK